MRLPRLIRNIVVTGNAAGLVSLVTAIACSRRAPVRLAPVNAVAHIWSGRHPLRHALAPEPRNAAIGFLLHQGAAVFWAGFFEPLFGRSAERSTPAALVGGAAISAAAYFTDYHLVGARFRPGYEAALSRRSLLLVYGVLAAAFAVSARSRGLRHHQVENHHERDERRHAERSPDTVITPVERR